jgi:hypothetical protein
MGEYMSIYANTMLLYMRNSNIHGFGYPKEVLKPILMDTQE